MNPQHLGMFLYPDYIDHPIELYLQTGPGILHPTVN
jgi:hypothetical protein